MSYYDDSHYFDERMQTIIDRAEHLKFAIQPRRDIGYLPINLGQNLHLERQFRREEEAKADARHAAKVRSEGLERLRRDYGL